jgi:hypothetical protein
LDLGVDGYFRSGRNGIWFHPEESAGHRRELAQHLGVVHDARLANEALEEGEKPKRTRYGITRLDDALGHRVADGGLVVLLLAREDWVLTSEPTVQTGQPRTFP